MVSLRRRKLMGLCSGVGDSPDSSNPASVRPMPLANLNLNLPPEEDNDPDIDSSDVTGNSQPEDQNNQPGVSISTSPKQPNTEQVKRRKQHRRRGLNNQEENVMRGVYFKNMKWQAAIKVKNKQVHLGTVSSQQEAARLYDRAAFVCGRKPNIELPEEEKQKLRKLQWNEFLAMTRSAIASKRTKRVRAAPPSVQSPDVRVRRRTGS